MDSRTVEHWYHEEHPDGIRHILLRTNGHAWRVEISVGPLSGPRKIWDWDTEEDAREQVTELKRWGGRVEWWRSAPVGGRG